MANRSKKTVLSVRISPYAKAGLDVLSAVRRQSLPELIESLVERELAKERLGSQQVSAQRVLRAIWTDDPLLYKLRLSCFTGTALNPLDEVAAQVVLMSPIFSGEDNLFSGPAAEIIRGIEDAIPRVSLDKARQLWPILIGYAKFLEVNSLKPSFKDYIDLLQKSSQLSSEDEAALFGDS